VKILVFDVETTTHDHGTPFSKYNKLVCIGWKCLWKNDGVQVRYVDTLYEDFLDDLNECTDIVGFNIKFDLHWLRSLGCRSFQRLRIWDCQLARNVVLPVSGRAKIKPKSPLRSEPKLLFRNWTRQRKPLLVI